jgi:hypothetical protein
MDFQHRPGGKTGSGGVASSSESNRDRRERLRQLALETIDINKVGQAASLLWTLQLGHPRPQRPPARLQPQGLEASQAAPLKELYFPKKGVAGQVQSALTLW